MTYIVKNKESGLSVQFHNDVKEAEKQAKQMTEYHQTLFIVEEKG